MSNIIQLLPEAIANQIAAGEVVQRPASAVKELLENAIDAGADKIQLIVKDGGKSLIQIIDNGCGMSTVDARLSFSRHATSKISKAADLFAIKTMGFRGEALASIASIAQVDLQTRLHEEELGTLISIEASDVIREEPVSTPAGTKISVKNLFYNVPARRNFLKSNAVELRHIIEEFQRIALAHPNVMLNLHNEQNELFRLTSEGLKNRIIHVFGKAYHERLVPVEENTTIINLKGFIGKPAFAKKTRGEQYLFVNQRFVKDAYLNHAIVKAYEGLLPEGSYPLYILFIAIDPAQIDINVHPTKTEIKYQDERAIYAIIHSAIKRSLGKFNIAPSLDFDQEVGFGNMISPKKQEDIVPPSIRFNPNFNPFDLDQVNEPSQPYHRQKTSVPSGWEQLYQVTEREQVTQLTLRTEGDLETDELPRSKTIFQLHQRFIVAQIRSGFLIIDQQAAHERVLYENMLAQIDNNQHPSQQSLFPQTVSFSPIDAEILSEILPEITALGFQIRAFGKNTFILEGVPADLGTGNREVHLLEKFLESYKQYAFERKLDKRDNLARSLAKSLSIKNGVPLTTIEMNELVDRLFACHSPNVSLSGKSIILTYTLTDLIDKFKK